MKDVSLTRHDIFQNDPQDIKMLLHSSEKLFRELDQKTETASGDDKHDNVMSISLWI